MQQLDKLASGIPNAIASYFDPGRRSKLRLCATPFRRMEQGAANGRHHRQPQNARFAKQESEVKGDAT